MIIQINFKRKLLYVQGEHATIIKEQTNILTLTRIYLWLIAQSIKGQCRIISSATFETLDKS